MNVAWAGSVVALSTRREPSTRGHDCRLPSGSVPGARRRRFFFFFLLLHRSAYCSGNRQFPCPRASTASSTTSCMSPSTMARASSASDFCRGPSSLQVRQLQHQHSQFFDPQGLAVDEPAMSSGRPGRSPGYGSSTAPEISSAPRLAPARATASFCCCSPGSPSTRRALSSAPIKAMRKLQKFDADGRFPWRVCPLQRLDIVASHGAIYLSQR